MTIAHHDGRIRRYLVLSPRAVFREWFAVPDEKQILASKQCACHCHCCHCHYLPSPRQRRRDGRGCRSSLLVGHQQQQQQINHLVDLECGIHEKTQRLCVPTKKPMTTTIKGLRRRRRRRRRRSSRHPNLCIHTFKHTNIHIYTFIYIHSYTPCHLENEKRRCWCGQAAVVDAARQDDHPHHDHDDDWVFQRSSSTRADPRSILRSVAIAVDTEVIPPVENGPGRPWP